MTAQGRVLDRLPRRVPCLDSVRYQRYQRTTSDDEAFTTPSAPAPAFGHARRHRRRPSSILRRRGGRWSARARRNSRTSCCGASRARSAMQLPRQPRAAGWAMTHAQYLTALVALHAQHPRSGRYAGRRDRARWCSTSSGSRPSLFKSEHAVSGVGRPRARRGEDQPRHETRAPTGPTRRRPACRPRCGRARAAARAAMARTTWPSSRRSSARRSTSPRNAPVRPASSSMLSAVSAAGKR